MDRNDLEHRFAYHPPKDEATKKKHENVRFECFNLANTLNKSLPEGREKSLAITHLEETMMWANASIARQTTEEATK